MCYHCALLCSKTFAHMLLFVGSLLWSSVITWRTRCCWNCDLNHGDLTIILALPETIGINLSHSLAWINQITPAAVQPIVGSGRDQNVTGRTEPNATQVPCKSESCMETIRRERGCRSGTCWIIIPFTYTDKLSACETLPLQHQIFSTHHFHSFPLH